MANCTCSHADDEHERNRAGHLAACTVEIDGEKCDCVLYEWDGEPEPD